MLLDTILEEAGGMLCGLPPGTVTAATAVASVASADAGNEETEQVQNKTQDLSKKEEKIIKTAVHNVAITTQRDNPFWSQRKCAKFSMSVLLIADDIYHGDDFKAAILDAVSTNPDRHRRLISNVGQAVS